MINLKEILIDASNADHNIFLFSSFVNDTEFASTYLLSNGAFKAIDKDECRNSWQDMEILNALALSDWEEDGQPMHWDEKWRENYQGEAKILIDNFLKSISPYEKL